MQPRTALKPILILRKALQPKTEKNLICSGVYRGPAAKSAPDCAGGAGTLSAAGAATGQRVALAAARSETHSSRGRGESIHRGTALW